MLTKTPASDCTLGFKQSDDKGASLSQRDACRHCGRTEKWHKDRAAVELPSDEQAEEFLILAKYKYTQFYELAKVLLTRYIEWKKSQEV